MLRFVNIQHITQKLPCICNIKKHRDSAKEKGVGRVLSYTYSDHQIVIYKISRSNMKIVAVV